MILFYFHANELLAHYYRMVAEIGDKPGVVQQVCVFDSLLEYFPELECLAVCGSKEEIAILYCFIAELYESGEL